MFKINRFTVLGFFIILTLYCAEVMAFTGQAESAVFCLGDSPPPLPGENEVVVSQLTITGDVISRINDNQWEISGNVMINNTVRLTGTVSANTATLRVQGDGQVWIDGVPLLGDVLVYEGPWEFDGETGKLVQATGYEAPKSGKRAIAAE